MNYKPSDIFYGMLFSGLIIGTGFMQTHLKNEPQLWMLLLGILTLGTFFAKSPFNTSIPFYILLGVMIYINISILMNCFVNIINPEDGWFTDINGERRRIMSYNWIWGVLMGFILTPVIVVLYYKKVKRNRILEISFTTIFIIMTGVIYISYELI